MKWLSEYTPYFINHGLFGLTLSLTINSRVADPPLGHPAIWKASLQRAHGDAMRPSSGAQRSDDVHRNGDIARLEGEKNMVKPELMGPPR